MSTTKTTTVRLSAQDKQRIAKLIRKLEVSQTDVIRLALKTLAEKEGVEHG